MIRPSEAVVNRSSWSRWRATTFTAESGRQAGSPGRNPPATPTPRSNVVARYRDQLDLFMMASDGRIMSTWWNVRGGWGTWFQVSGGRASSGSEVTAISRYSNHLDLFVVGTDNRIYSTWWHDPGGWAGWFNVSGGVSQAGGQVAALSRSAEHIDRLHRRLRRDRVQHVVGRSERLGRVVPARDHLTRRRRKALVDAAQTAGRRQRVIAPFSSRAC